MSTRGYNEVGSIRDQISSFTRQITKLERLLAKVGTQADNYDFRDMLSKEEKAATSTAKRIMTSITNGAFDTSIKRDLSGEFQPQFQRFQKVTSQLESKQSSVLQAASRKDSSQLNNYQQDQAFSDGDITFVEYNIEEIEKRHGEIKTLEQDVLEIAEMFKDLAVLVDQQQEGIDTIDNNISETRDKVESAHKELQQAEEYQKKSRKKLCCLTFIVLIVIAIIVIVVFVLKK